jgi:hypothetical protein
LQTEIQKNKKITEVVRSKSPSHVVIRREQDHIRSDEAPERPKSASKKRETEKPRQRRPLSPGTRKVESPREKLVKSSIRNGHVENVKEEDPPIRIIRHHQHQEVEEPVSLSLPEQHATKPTTEIPPQLPSPTFDQASFMHSKFDALSRMLTEKLNNMDSKFDTAFNNLNKRMTIVEGKIKFIESSVREQQTPSPPIQHYEIPKPEEKRIPEKIPPVVDPPVYEEPPPVDMSVDTMSFIHEISARFKETQKVIDQLRKTNN